MPDNQKSKTNNHKWFYKASASHRLGHLAIVLAGLAIFAIFYMVKADIIDPSWHSGPCVFKQTYGIPCPTCGMTTAVKLLFSGKLISAFYTQPGIVMFCLLVAVIAFFSLLSAVLGLNFSFLPPPGLWRGGYIVLILLIIFAAGWAVTLARALSS